MWIKYLHDRKVRKFWENEAKNAMPRKVVKVSENVWHIVDPYREVERVLPYAVFYKDDTNGKSQN